MRAHMCLHHVACPCACVCRSCFLRVRRSQRDTITHLPRTSPGSCHATEEASISERSSSETQADLLHRPQGVVEQR
jgi:hypothetical protein